MVNTTLRAYLDELNLLLEQEALEEVIGHCRHILQYFPRNVETYRFLARALLEKRRHAEAADVFQRVLSTLPDDFVSHLGLSSVSEEQGQFPSAVWHLERAYEQEPNNVALQGELQRLYERRDGSAPTRIQMTHGALVRIYAKGRLFDQAIHELQIALAQAPDRVDLAQLLADVMWYTDRPMEAGEVVLRILEKLPDSIEANRLMATLWLKSGRPSEAAPFVARLEQLDPFLAWQTVQVDGKPLPPNAFQLPRLDWDARAAAALATDVPDWVNAISNVFEAPESVSLGGANDWLEEAVPAPEAPRSPLAGFDVFSTNRHAPAETAPAEPPIELPDWMADEPVAAAPAQEPDLPDWFKDEEASPAAVESSENTLPAWFDEAVGATDETAPAGEQLPSGFTDLLTGISNKRNVNASMSAETPPTVTDLPDWMSELETESPAKEAPTQSLGDESWMATDSLPLLEDAAPAGSPAPGESEEQPLDAMSWLTTGPLPPLENATPAAEASVPETGAFSDISWQVTGSLPPVEQATSAPGSVADMDWLQDMASDGAVEPVAVEPEVMGGDLDWLGSLPALETPAAEPAAEPEVIGGDLDWLGSLPAVETPAAAEPAAEPEAMGGDLDWLGSLPAVETPAAEPAAEPEAIGGDLDWLGSLPAVETPAAAEPAAEPEAMGGDLDWLGSKPALETPAAEPAAEPEAIGGDLDWLGNLPALETPAAAEPAAEPEAMGGDLDWLGSLPALETPAAAEPVAAEPEAIGGDLDWLGSLPAVETPAAAEPAAADAADADIDWFGSLSASVPEAGMEPAPAVDSALDWLSGAPDIPLAEAEEIADQPASDAADLFELGTASSEPAALDGMDPGVGMAQTEAQPLEEGDPMAWLRPYQTSEGIQDSLGDLGDVPDLEAEAAEESGELAQAETPSWLSAMAPALAADQPPVEAASLDALDFSALQSEPEAPTEDWLASQDLLPEPAKPAALDWLTQPTQASAVGDEPAVELEEDWLASFEAPLMAEAASGTPDGAAPWQPPVDAEQPAETAGESWQSSFEVQSAPTEATPNSDWFASLAVDQNAPEAATPSAEDWLGSLSVPPPEPERAPESALPDLAAEPAVDENWFAALGAPDAVSDLAAPPEPVQTTPAPEPAASKPSTGRLDSLVKQAADRPAPAPINGQAGVLDGSEEPDWLAALDGDMPVAEPAADLSFDNLEMPSSTEEMDLFEEAMPAEGATPTPEATPAWLSDLAPAGQPAAAAPSLDDLDFGSLDMAEPAEEIPFEAAEVPAWMADLAPASAPGGSPPQAKALDELDFGSLEAETTAGDAVPETAPEEFDFSGLFGESAQPAAAAQPAPDDRSRATNRPLRDPFAEPANLVDTSGSAGGQKAPPAPGFKFDRPPAWTRKGAAASKPAAQVSANQGSAEDLPDWLKGATDSSGSQKEDLPDWLK